MKAMILAAGLGTRLRPLTDHTPKPLLPIGGRPMIEYNLLLLKRYGITEIVINLHHFGEQIKTALGDGSHYGLKFTYSEETEILDTGGGIRKVKNFFGETPFIVMNGDILIDINLHNLISFHRKQKATATLVLRENPDQAAFGTIEIDPSGQIRNIRGKLDMKNQTTRKMMFTGLHILDPAALSYIPENTPYSIIDAYIDMIRSNEKLMAFITEGYWNDLGQHERYQEAQKSIDSGTLQLGFLDEINNNNEETHGTSHHF